MKIHEYVKNVMKKELIQDKIKAGYHQEVLRKIKFLRLRLFLENFINGLTDIEG